MECGMKKPNYRLWVTTGVMLCGLAPLTPGMAQVSTVSDMVTVPPTSEPGETDDTIHSVTTTIADSTPQEGETMTQVQQESTQDPLNSPHPVPWNWVLATQAAMHAAGEQGVRYYRSPSLLSPDGQYAAYSRMQLHVTEAPHTNHVDSVLFVENLNTGSLGVITARSPFAAALGSGSPQPLPGSISLLVPVSWSADSQQMLAREFDGIFNSSDLTDYGLVWNRHTNDTTLVAPQSIDYSTAVLLGWSGQRPDQVLFQAGQFGQEEWALWQVNLEGETAIAFEDQPLVLGQQVTNLWDGPQAHWSSPNPNP